ncbi:hypothetical protein [Kamptonema formosum]|uniref:hypothetical protein n=1 Tax=Kamptonema formosum TaxID=331992 RepID=UPI0018E26B45|nr:hypothetical protein [Oscillatoria sp. PCC 10802]
MAICSSIESRDRTPSTPLTKRGWGGGCCGTLPFNGVRAAFPSSPLPVRGAVGGGAAAESKAAIKGMGCSVLLPPAL